jgi:hypothetical protein
MLLMPPVLTALLSLLAGLLADAPFSPSGVGTADRGRRIPAVNPIQSSIGWHAEAVLIAALVAPVALALLGAIRLSVGIRRGWPSWPHCRR